MSELGESRRVLVTGAGGMLALDLVPALRAAGHAVTALGRLDLDITDPTQCVAGVSGHDLVINTAAYTAVDDAETHEAAAFAVNAVGAANLARAASRTGARMVQISTDYVFDGAATTPYAVDHPVNPQSAYGRSKAAGEWAVRALCPDSWVVRTAWLYGAGGPNFVTTMIRLASERETISVVDDQVGQPTWTVDLADQLVRMVHVDAPPGVYHATSGGQTSWYGFAREIFTEAGLEENRVLPTTAAEFARPAPRPAYGALSPASLQALAVDPIPDWQEGLRTFLSRT